jgi:hypothetical protein
LSKEDTSNLNSVLTGTTLKVYRLLVTKDVPLGPREIQKTLGLSSHSVALFHLEKLERSRLITKDPSEGTYTVDRVYLKNYILLRRHLVPRYFFYAILSSAMIVGWGSLLFLGGMVNPSVGSFSRETVFFIFIYGAMSISLLALIFWYETINVLKKERI